MEKFSYADGDKIGYFDGEKGDVSDSEYILRYKRYAESKTKND